MRLSELFRSTGVKLAAACAAFFFFATFVTTIVAVYQISDDLDAWLDRSLKETSNYLLNEFKEGGVQGLAESVNQHAGASQGDNEIYLLIDAAGKKIAGNVSKFKITRGWHDVRIRVPGSRPSNAIRVAVDLPVAEPPTGLLRHFRRFRITGASDGATWKKNEVALASGRTISLWLAQLPENADRNTLRVFLDGRRLEISHVDAKSSDKPRQVNAKIPEGVGPGRRRLRAEIGPLQSSPVWVTLT